MRRTTTEASSLSARRLALRPINSLLDTTIYSPSRLGDFHCRQPCLGFNGAWVKHSPPKRLRNASAVAGSGKQNRIWNCSTSCRLRRGGLGCVVHGGTHQSLGKHCESLPAETSARPDAGSPVRS